MRGRLAGSMKLHRNPLGLCERVQPLEGTIAVKGIRIQSQHIQVCHLVQDSLGDCGQMVVGQVPVGMGI